MLLLLALACGEPTPAEAIEAWVAEQGLSFRECEPLELAECTESPDPEDQARINCITGAFANCSAARFEVTEFTIEGDPILITYFVVPEGDTCSVTRFIDNSQDAFGDGLLHQYTCTSVEESTECPWVAAQGCTEQS